MADERVTASLRRVPVPKTRDPFVNTPLIAVPGKPERFWISSWNDNVGTTGVLVDASGEHRIYRFGCGHPGFYSAVAFDDRTLWLCGNLSRLVRLDLESGAFDVFETGAPGALVFQGMAYDPPTGKLFAAAFPPPHAAAFSFDILSGRTAKIWTAFSDAHYMRFSFPNGDGTHSIVMHLPGVHLLRWDPRTDALEEQVIAPTLDLHAAGALTHFLVEDDTGRRYFPGRGWYNGRIRRFEGGRRPEREMTWLARRGERVLGAASTHRTAEIAAWDMRTGEVETICEINDASAFNINVTADSRIVAVNMYGEFFRFDGSMGALQCSKRLPTDAVGRVDCVCRIDADRVLGTPFITQRFWEANLATGEGVDCGRAAPGGGEILRTWRIGGKVYMAAYTGGELTEYDPSRSARFPENPRVVAKPPHGMRPVASADDGRVLWYACSAPYGHLGCVLTRYDTRTGEATYASHPLDDQQIVSLFFDAKRRLLVAGTTFHADCQSRPPAADACVVALIDPDTLRVARRATAPAGVECVKVAGPLDGRRMLLWLPGHEFGRMVVDVDEFQAPGREGLIGWPQGFKEVKYAGVPGRFVLRVEDRLELWDLRTDERMSRLAEESDIRGFYVQDRCLIVVTREELQVHEGCLPAF